MRRWLGPKRTAWAATWTFRYLNGVELDPGFGVDDAENFMNAVAAGRDLEMTELAPTLQDFASQ